MDKRDIYYSPHKMEEKKAQAEEKKKPVKKKSEKSEEKRDRSLINREASLAGGIIRILQTDIPENKNIYTGLTRIKGVSWAISNALCKLIGIDKKRIMNSLTKEEITKIEEKLKEGVFPRFLINRKNDFETGEDKHLVGNDLDISKEMDIKRLKKIRSYRGLRHATGQPTRGQSTRSHFRENRKKGVGIKFKKRQE